MSIRYRWEGLGPAPALAFFAGIIAFLTALRNVWQSLETARGVEADFVARAIAGGHGFSFPENRRWLWDRWDDSGPDGSLAVRLGDPDTYFPTAWVDPVFTHLLAGAHWLFGEHAYTVVLAFGLPCFIVILFCAYHLGRHLAGPWAGAMALVLLALHQQALGTMFDNVVTNDVVAATAVIVAALTLVRYCEQPTVGRLTAAGLATGFMVLLNPSVKYFLVLLPFIVVAMHWRGAYLRPLAWKDLSPSRPDWAGLARGTGHAALLLACTAAVLTPWAVRNYLVFDEFVLVRNGGGQVAWLSTVGAGETFMPGTAGSPLAAPWQSDGPRDAIFKMSNQDLRRQFHPYQVRAQEAAGVPGFDTMNEAQRDKLYMGQSQAFLREHPVVSAQMSLAKLQIYVFRHGRFGVLTVALAMLGALLALRHARSWPVTFILFSYSVAFAVIIAFYSRYRAPVEPLMTVMAAVGVVLAADLVRQAVGQRLGTPGSPAPASDGSVRPQATGPQRRTGVGA